MMRALRPLALALALIGCAPQPIVETSAPASEAPPGYPRDFYRSLPADELRRIDTADSLASVRVTRDGPLARLGHDHIVASRSIGGQIWLPGGQPIPGARVDLFVPLATLTVDEAALRGAAGLETTPTEDDIAGTRANMHKSLDTDLYPWLTLTGTLTDTGTLDASLTLHGVTAPYSIPIKLDQTNGRLDVTGSFTLLQTEHGITPFSTLGGALSVGDALIVNFSLVAK